MKRTLLLILLIQSAINSFSQPTGFPTPIIWLRADNPQNTSSHWADASGNNNHATTGNSDLQINDRFLNFNPSFIFDGIDDYFEISYDRSRQSSQLTFVTVYFTNKTETEQNIWVIVEGYNSSLTTKNISGPQKSAGYFGGDLNSPVINTVRQTWGKTDQSGTEGTILIGGTLTGQDETKPFKGHIAEFLVFDQLLENEDFQMLGTYLSAKYGATFYLEYLNSKKEVIWDHGTKQNYNWRVAAIGRDDGFGLNQKQSTTRNEGGLLTIAAGSISVTNKDNNYELKKNDFLIFGDQGGEINIEQVPPEGFATKLPLMDRKWLIRATGRTANEIPTELMINATGLLTDPPICYLLVDRSGTGNFAGEQTEYILYDSITEQGQVYFKNLQWDTDDSGQDSYSFSLGYFKNETLIAGREDETAYFTNTDIQQKFKSVQGDFLKNATITALPEHGELKLNGQPVNIGDNLPLEEPAKFSFEPSPDWNGKTKLSWKGLVDYSLSGLPGLSVASIEGDVVINIVPENDLPLIDHIIAGTEDDLLLNFTITDFSDVFTDVDGDKLAWVQIRELPENGTLSLNGIPLEVDNKIIKEKLSQMIYTAYDDKLLYDSFLWNASDGIAYADSSKRAGMVLADKEKLQSNGGGMSALVYPNPAKELFRLTVLLENESGILLEIFNSKGQTVLIKNESDQSKTLFNYEFNGFEPGVYFIKIKTQSQFQSLKLIVE